MTITRRTAMAGLLGAPALLAASRAARADTRTLKISHQFPGGTIDQGDFRDRLVRRFAAEVEK
ncbi:MAG: C4-dicarboxylate ABC transporter, partial [Proteobacteria bacterium]|nr:C4-dicarboxylate ABC transporter [Pseudomonadota bacterium]